jgi:hypothetical protein
MVNGKPFFDKEGKLRCKIFLQISLKIFSLPLQKPKKRNLPKDLRNLKIKPLISILMRRKTKGLCQKYWRIWFR